MSLVAPYPFTDFSFVQEVSGDKRWTGNDGYEAVMGGMPLTRPRLSQA